MGGFSVSLVVPKPKTRFPVDPWVVEKSWMELKMFSGQKRVQMKNWEERRYWELEF